MENEVAFEAELEQMIAEGRATPQDAAEVRRFYAYLRDVHQYTAKADRSRCYFRHYPEDWPADQPAPSWLYEEET